MVIITSKRKLPAGYSTLEEHEAWLKETGQYDAMIARRREREEAQLRLMEECRLAEAPLVEELRANGLQVQSVWDLAGAHNLEARIVAILLDHLSREYPPVVRDGLGRALAVPEARVGWDVLTAAYRSEQAGRGKGGLAVAIAAVANDDLIGDVIALARDKNNGSSRLLLLEALGRSRLPMATSALFELADDPDLSKEVQLVLRRHRKLKR